MNRNYLVTALLAAMTVPNPAPAQSLLLRKPKAAVEVANLRLGAGDQIAIWVRDSDEITSRSYRIDESGELGVPLIGRVHAGGLTISQLEVLLAERLKPVLLEPDVHISVAELRSSPVTVTGAVKAPGLIQLRDRITLLQAISLSGGLAPDAGHLVRVTRKAEQGKIPLTSATVDASGDYSSVEEDLNDLLSGTGAAANLTLEPNDVVYVSQAPVIYVMGEVKHAGGLALARKEPDLSILQALAMAEGMTDFAAPKKALILRPGTGATRQAINVDLKAVMAGKAEDLKLRPNDILIIPNNRNLAKTIATQVAQIAASVAVGVTIVRAGRR